MKRSLLLQTLFPVTAVFIVFFSLTICLLAGEPIIAPFNSVLSETRQNVLVGFWNGVLDKSENINFPINKPIEYGFCSTQSVPCEVFTLDEKYGCIISAKTEFGQEVRKTHYGRKFGDKFSSVIGFDRGQFTRGRGQFPYLAVAGPNRLLLGRKLPPLEQLFKFEKPGNFIVSVRLQCLVGPYNKSMATNVHLVRFPPVELHVIKEK